MCYAMPPAVRLAYAISNERAHRLARCLYPGPCVTAEQRAQAERDYVQARLYEKWPTATEFAFPVPVL